MVDDNSSLDVISRTLAAALTAGEITREEMIERWSRAVAAHEAAEDAVRAAQQTKPRWLALRDQARAPSALRRAVLDLSALQLSLRSLAFSGKLTTQPSRYAGLKSAADRQREREAAEALKRAKVEAVNVLRGVPNDYVDDEPVDDVELYFEGCFELFARGELTPEEYIEQCRPWLSELDAHRKEQADREEQAKREEQARRKAEERARREEQTRREAEARAVVNMIIDEAESLYGDAQREAHAVNADQVYMRGGWSLPLAEDGLVLKPWLDEHKSDPRLTDDDDVSSLVSRSIEQFDKWWDGEFKRRLEAEELAELEKDPRDRYVDALGMPIVGVLADRGCDAEHPAKYGDVLKWLRADGVTFRDVLVSDKHVSPALDRMRELGRLEGSTTHGDKRKHAWLAELPDATPFAEKMTKAVAQRAHRKRGRH